MPPLSRHPDGISKEHAVYIVTHPKTGTTRQAQVLHRRGDEVYVHFLNTDRRLDEWVSVVHLRPAEPHEITEPVEVRGKKRKRGSSTAVSRDDTPRSASFDFDSGDDSDTGEHLRLTAKRNFDRVNFGHWQIKTWYFSPYPLSESEQEEGVVITSADPFAAARAAERYRLQSGIPRTTLRAHGRTADLVAGGLGRDTAAPAGYNTLWVCDRCFKYMREGVQWELHIKSCKWTHPPGRKVYERGAHVIWEVDGAQEKLYCQNLSLFGKLFIDVKTLFFDTENFMFYLLTDADSQRDHVLGFFSKEKISYDNYNLACIVTLPPYQRKGYGMLLIEFSYELSRRAGVVGTPERPLSDLGLRSYVTFWISVLVRFFRRVLTVAVPEIARISGTSIDALTADAVRRRRRITKSVDGDSPFDVPAPPPLPSGPMNSTEEPFFENFRRLHTLINADGSATTHVIVACTLEDIAAATALRPEDAAFALKECGLLQRRRRPNVAAADSPEGVPGAVYYEDQICVSREMVEAVARARGVKKNMMELNHVLL